MTAAIDEYANIAANEDSISRALLTFGVASKAAEFTEIRAAILFQVNHGVISTKGLK
jgi:hypothetical protein